MDDEYDLIDDNTDDQVEEKVKGLVLALTLDNGALPPITPAVFTPPGLLKAMADNPILRDHIDAQLVEAMKPITMDDMRARVHRELDPMGMAIAIAQGLSIPVYTTKGATVEVKYVQVGMRERLSILKKLMEFVTDDSAAKQKQKQSIDNPGDAHAFLAMVKRAGQVADQALRDVRIINAEASRVEAEVSDEEKAALDGA